MACFLVSAAEAIVVTVAEKVMEKKEKNTVLNYIFIPQCHQWMVSVQWKIIVPTQKLWDILL